MWKILFSAEAERETKDQFRKGLLTDEDREVISTWIKQIAEYGPESLREGSNFWYDHDLQGEWRGYRASAFSFKGRIIYKIENRIVTVLVVRITTAHDYKKARDK
ncbi:MAG: hypothetical protein WCG27_04485 [Pseudomonadota bacterium]